ncbi:MAG: hypothetical protein AAGF12_13795 [Myxococcota bacterium]
MPLPTLVCLAFASGVAAALASRAELRVSPRPALLTRSFGAYALFAMLLLVPVSAYFYIFHGDWFLLYVIDVRRIPSAIALIGFLFEAVIGAAGFFLAAQLVRGGRDIAASVFLGVALLAGAVVLFIAPDRLSKVGSFAEFRGGFGLTEFGTGPLLQGTIAMGSLLLLGLIFLLYRLHASGRRR